MLKMMGKKIFTILGSNFLFVLTHDLYFRIFDLRNMPYTTGRILSWYDDIEPVASPQLREFVHIQAGILICYTCARKMDYLDLQIRGYIYISLASQ